MVDAFARLVADAQDEERVVGLVLGGSRGKGLGTPRSDYDVYVVVRDDVDPAVPVLVADYEHDGIEVVGAWTVAGFAAYGMGDGHDWNRYTFAHLRPPVDKLGTLRGLCAAKEWLTAEEARGGAEQLLGVYLNSRYRAAKNHRDGDLLAATLDVAESVPAMLELVFRCERRVRPYNKFLQWELARHPLEHDWGIAGRAATAGALLRSGYPSLQAGCFQAVERVARQLGHGAVLEAWRHGELALMRSSEH